MAQLQAWDVRRAASRRARCRSQRRSMSATGPPGVPMFPSDESCTRRLGLARPVRTCGQSPGAPVCSRAAGGRGFASAQPRRSPAPRARSTPARPGVPTRDHAEEARRVAEGDGIDGRAVCPTGSRSRGGAVPVRRVAAAGACRRRENRESGVMLSRPSAAVGFSRKPVVDGCPQVEPHQSWDAADDECEQIRYGRAASNTSTQSGSPAPFLPGVANSCAP